MSDNGPEFTSVEFDVFLKSNGVRHICSALYTIHSRMEKLKDLCKLFKTRKQDKGSVQTKLSSRIRTRLNLSRGSR